MEKSGLEEMDDIPNPMGVNTVRNSITGAVGAEEVAVTRYQLAPGEAFSAGLHTHRDQEEMFYIVSGTATFEVGAEREEVSVEAGEVIHFARGEFQTGDNRSDEEVVGLAISAPGRRHDWAELDVLYDCEECGEETLWTCGEDGPGDWENREIDIDITCQSCGNVISTAALE